MNDKEFNLARHKIYEILKTELLKYKTDLHSETYGIEKIDFKEIINIEEILDLILNDERKNIRLLPYIDLTNISFNEQNITNIDFTNTNASINPQTVKGKNFLNVKLNGDFKNCKWDEACLCNTDFSNAKNVRINPQTIMYKSLYGCICKGIDFDKCSFNGVSLIHTDLRGTHNVVIYKNEIWNRNIQTTIFDENTTIIEISHEKVLEEDLRQNVLKKILKQIPKQI